MLWEGMMATCSYGLWVKEDYLCLLQVFVKALSFGSFSSQVHSSVYFFCSFIFVILYNYQMTLFIQRNDSDHLPCLLDLPTKFLPLFSLSLFCCLLHIDTCICIVFCGRIFVLFIYLGSIESAKPKAKHFILEIQDFLK